MLEFMCADVQNILCFHAAICNVECTLLTTWPMATVGSAAAELGTIFTIFFPLFSLEYFCED